MITQKTAYEITELRDVVGTRASGSMYNPFVIYAKSGSELIRIVLQREEALALRSDLNRVYRNTR